MRQLFKVIYKLKCDNKFSRFQKSLSYDLYKKLGEGYSRNDNEVALVQKLVDAVNGKSYGPISLHAKMLHGSRSYVEFNYLDKPVTNIVITVTSKDGEVKVYEESRFFKGR